MQHTYGTTPPRPLAVGDVLVSIADPDGRRIVAASTAELYLEGTPAPCFRDPAEGRFSPFIATGRSPQRQTLPL